MKRKHTSASATDRFVRCPANYVSNYDEEMKISTRSEATDAGVLVHAALEVFRNPENEIDQSDFSELEAAYEWVCRDHLYAESFAVYKRGKVLLAQAFKLGQFHPTIPIYLAKTLAVEQPLIGLDGKLWRMPSWPRPAKGAIDRVAVIPLAAGMHILFIEDYKTGFPSSHEEIVNEGIQAGLYFLYARTVLVPWLESQGILIARICGSWTYVAYGSAVALYESDFDHAYTESYIANISDQIIAFEDKYAAAVTAAVNEHPPLHSINTWLAAYEKPNLYCGYCPRRHQCRTFERLLRYDSKIALTGEEIDWGSVWTEHETYRIIAKNADSRVKEIKDLIRVYLEQEGLASIPLPDGEKELTANPQSFRKYRVNEVIEIFGTEFILRNASVTDDAIQKEIALVARTDPKKARELEAVLPTLYTSVPGARPVKARKIPKPRKVRK